MAKWFEKIPKDVLGRGIERGLAAVGALIEGDAILRVPVDTGRLRGSLSFATKDRAAKTQEGVSQPGNPYTVWIGTNVEYAADVEYPGKTRKWAGKPYLRPALDHNRKKAKKLLAREIMREYGR